jgi:hypothetical protein
VKIRLSDGDPLLRRLVVGPEASGDSAGGYVRGGSRHVLQWFRATSATTGSYLICSTPRSGSTLLWVLLQSTGIAGRPESYFRLSDEPTWVDQWRIARDPDGSFDYRDYVQAAIRDGSTENGVFGSRVMWGTMDEIVAKLNTVYRDLAGADLDLLSRVLGRTRFVYLYRGDAVAQAVSWARAEQTGYWHHGDTSANESHFELDQIQGFVEMIDEREEEEPGVSESGPNEDAASGDAGPRGRSGRSPAATAGTGCYGDTSSRRSARWSSVR